HDGDVLVAVDLEIDAIEGADLLRADGVVFGDVLKADDHGLRGQGNRRWWAVPTLQLAATTKRHRSRNTATCGTKRIPSAEADPTNTRRDDFNSWQPPGLWGLWLGGGCLLLLCRGRGCRGL